MKRLLLVFALLAAVAACTSESNLPVATGKGTIRAINAVVASPSIAFRIEERFLGNVDYQSNSVSSRFDDFEYIFNFEVFLLGDVDSTRITSVTQKIDADKDYSFVISGDLLNPTVTVWEGDEREWDGTETVFEVRFGHTAATMGDIDVYLAPDGTLPAIGEELGTLSFGEILPAVDFEAANLVITVTRAGDPLDILYQSDIIAFLVQSALTIPFFDGDELNTAAYIARVISVAGSLQLPDIKALPTVRFIQASFDLANSDVYDDEMLTSLVLSDHAFADFTGDLPIAVGTTSYTYTTVGDTSAILFESGITTIGDRHFNFLVIGGQGARSAQTFIPDRRSVSTFAKIRPFHAALQNVILDFYVVDAGVPIDDEFPLLTNMIYSLPSPTLAFDTGSYDLYATVPGEKTIVAGPVQVDVVLGDVVEIIIIDTVDPATADFLILPTL
jgi:hypothetical protein